MNVKIKFTSIAFLFFAVFSALSVKTAAQSSSEILIVADQKAICRGIVAEDCLQIKHLSEENFALFRGKIENFNYRPGFFYVLSVRRVSRLNNPDNYTYSLKQILAREKSAQTSDKTPVVSASIFANQWKLTKIDGAPVNSQKALIRFNEKENSAGGNGGCNSFGGTLTLNGNQLKISEIISTQMYCQDASPVENKFFKKLEGITKYDVSSGKLRLWTNQEISLEFEAM